MDGGTKIEVTANVTYDANNSFVVNDIKFQETGTHKPTDATVVINEIKSKRDTSLAANGNPAVNNGGRRRKQLKTKRRNSRKTRTRRVKRV